MVSFKTLLIGTTAALCYSSSAMAAVASASASHIAARPSDYAIAAVNKQQQPQGQVAAPKEQAIDDFGDFLGDVDFPVALDEHCKTLTLISQNLDNIIERYVGVGLVCSEENRALIEKDVACTTSEGSTDLISPVVFPLALNQLQEMAERISAQTRCLDYLLTGTTNS